MGVNHADRKHSRFSASGAERWLSCPASVALEEKSPPQPESPWAAEGTLAHEVLESTLNRVPVSKHQDVTREMLGHVERTANKVRAIHKAFGGFLAVEKKVFAHFIHPDVFGTIDVFIAADDGVLHVIDFKYGAGKIVSPEKNSQLIQYALSIAESYNWDFIEAKLWILQPRAGDNWHKSWTVTIKDLQNFWLPIWQKGVARVLKGNQKPRPGNHCYWCKAKSICPAKTEMRTQKMIETFNNIPIERGINGEEKNEEKNKVKGTAKGKSKTEKEIGKATKSEEINFY